MPRSKQDPYKRKCAQAINHLAAAILDVNPVYEAWQETAERMAEALKFDHAAEDEENVQRRRETAEQLKTIMLGASAVREHLIKFIGDVWNLDEESIKTYIG